MMNLLRRIATLPGIRHVLLQPTTRRRVASVLALRFLRAALLTASPVRFVVAELVTSRGHVRTWPLRTGGIVTLMHRRAVAAAGRARTGHHADRTGRSLKPSSG